jgi:hypothetical protein
MLKFGLCSRIILTGLVFTAASFPGITAQDTVSDLKNDSIQLRLLELERTVTELSNTLAEQKKKDGMDLLLREADRLSAEQEKTQIDVSKKYFSGARQQQGLNPNISFEMDFFGSISSSGTGPESKPSDFSYGNNGFYLREAQLSLQAPLDPFTRGKAFISATPTGISVDEVYMEWLNLPLAMNLKAGFFKSEFGLLNRYHDHALPQFDRPRALVNLFGNEGLEGAGIEANFLLPAVIAHVTSLDVSLLYGSNSQSFASDSAKNLMLTGQFLNYYDLSASSYIEVRLSGAGGQTDYPGAHLNSFVGSAGVSYKWAPVGREKYRTVEWKTEVLYSYRELPQGHHQSKGFYSSLHCKAGARFWLGGRVGYSELPYDPSQSEWNYAVAVDFWQSEFVLTRLQYQFNDTNIYERKEMAGPFPGGHSLILQVCWAMGPHKHEAY